jgi:fructosamine-3-kinase
MCTYHYFGLDHDNYIGSLPQYNSPRPAWVRFFIEQRIEIQLKTAIDNGRAEPSIVPVFERLYKLLPSIMPEEKPALLHGDLWINNLIENERGEPCLVDPAVYYGSREAEIAYTYLFGGFERGFFDVYDATYPLQPGFGERIDLYNLYPLLVHVNLFGGGYLQQVKEIVRRFV